MFAQLPALRGKLARELVRSNAQLRFVSSELRELVLSSLPARERDVLGARSRVAPAALDVEGVPSATRARELLGLERSAKIAVVVSRLVPGKRVEVALAACARVRQLRTLVVGDGPELARLQQRFPEVAFVGHVERPLALAYIAAADVLVSASLSEGAPSVVREARALGTPVVCLEAGDLRAWAESDAGLSVVAMG